MTKFQKKSITRAMRAYKKDMTRNFNKMQSMFFLLTAVVLVVAVLFSFMFPESAHGCLVCAGTSLAGMAAVGNVDDVEDVQTSGNDIGYQVYLINLNQVDRTVAFPSPNGNRELGSIPMLAGEFFHYFIAHSFPEYESSIEKGDITTTGTNTLTLIMGGMRNNLINFQEEFTGGKFIVIFKEKTSGDWKVLGSIDDPIVLKKSENKHNKDGRYVTFTFERSSVKQYYTYVGAFSTVPPTVNAVDSDTLVVKPGIDQYEIPAGSAAAYAISKISGITASDKGRNITLIGTAVANPASISDGTLFTLEDGASWTAKAGSRITLRILDTTTLVEVDGTRVQIA